jgi:hypothetical protein
MTKFTIRKVGAGSNAWKFRVSSGRGLSYVCHGHFDTEAEAKAFIANPVPSVLDLETVMKRVETALTGAERRHNVGGLNFRLGYLTGSIATYFKKNPAAFEVFMKDCLHERLNER